MILQTTEFRKIKEKHAKDLLEFLIPNAEEFDILCSTDEITFNPELPKHISSAFGEVLVFTLANYTLSTAKIMDNTLTFEAGFGEENIGSIVSIPLKYIIQITEEETPLFINVSATIQQKEPEPQTKNPFELNPRNKKFMN